jgi:mRNA-degrading endonuclease RelE of RelBE toxin-antitoxin system
MAWTVQFTGKAQKQYEKLPEKIRLQGRTGNRGPTQLEWRYFGKLKGSSDCYHCHLKAGRPTYVCLVGRSWIVRLN